MNSHNDIKNFPKKEHYGVFVFGPLGLKNYMSFNSDAEVVAWCKNFDEMRYSIFGLEYVVIYAQPRSIPKDYKMG